MQALIDFDGWRKWKDFSQQSAEADSAKKAALNKKKKKNRMSLGSNNGTSATRIEEETEPAAQP
jgi:osomolarity two-component system response regulator SSK1